MMKDEHFFSVLKTKLFSLFAFGQMLSQFGDFLGQMALIALIGAHKERSPLAFSELTISMALPILLFGPIVGVLVDRWEKRKVLMVSDSLRALIVFLIPLLLKSTRAIFSVYSLVFFLFLFGLFSSASRMALIPVLAGKQRVLAANAVMNFIGRAAAVAGMILGGLIVGWEFWWRIGCQSWEAGFYLDALTFLFSVGTLALIKIKETTVPTREKSNLNNSQFNLYDLWRKKITAVGKDLLDSLQFIRGERVVLLVILSVVLVASFGGTLYALIILIIQQVAAKEIEGVGFLGGIMALGMMLGSFVLGMFGSRVDRKKIIIGGIGLLGIIIALFAHSLIFLWMIPLAFLAGLALSPVMISQDTLLHEIVPPSGHGRIFSTRDMVLNSGFVLSALVIGFMAQVIVPLFGVGQKERVTLFGVGILIFILSLIGQFWMTQNHRQK